MRIRPIIGFRGFKWFFKHDWFSVYKWEEPSAYSRSGRVLQRIVDIGAISIGFRYVNKVTAPQTSPTPVTDQTAG